MNAKENLQDKFISYIMLDWKKSLAIELMDKTLEEIKSRWQKDSKSIFNKAMENVMPKIEVRPKRIWWSIFQVPQEVSPKRQLFLASKRIIWAARGKKWGSFVKFLANELIDAANETWDAVKKKLDVYKMAEANKAFARFATKRNK